MIAKLEAEAESEATEKAYCDEQMAKTEAKKSELDDGIAKMTAKIDQAVAKSSDLKQQISTLEAELGTLAKDSGRCSFFFWGLRKLRGPNNNINNNKTSNIILICVHINNYIYIYIYIFTYTCI